MQTLGGRAGVSERFLAQLETGEGNISVARLQDVAEALGTTAAELLARTATRSPAPRKVVALLGLRGAGKSTLGPEVARRLGVPFFELDALVAREAGMPLADHLRDARRGVVPPPRARRAARASSTRTRAAVLATGGSLVTAQETYALLRERATTVWLKARPQDHWDRVLRQGDARPDAQPRQRDDRAQGAAAHAQAAVRSGRPRRRHVQRRRSTKRPTRVVAAVTTAEPATSTRGAVKR